MAILKSRVQNFKKKNEFFQTGLSRRQSDVRKQKNTFGLQRYQTKKSLGQGDIHLWVKRKKTDRDVRLLDPR